MYRVLIAEDDDAISRALKKYLESWGLEAACVTDFSDVMAEFAAYDPSWCFWISSCRFLTGITGAARSAPYRRSR